MRYLIDNDRVHTTGANTLTLKKKLAMFVISERDGTTHGSWSLVELLRGFNKDRPKADQLRRVHTYYCLRRNNREHRKRYKNVHIDRFKSARDVDRMYD